MGWGAAGIGAGIGALLGGPVGAAIGAGIGGLIGDDEEEENEQYSEATDAKIKVKQTIIDVDGVNAPGFRVKVKGTVAVPKDNCEIMVVLVIHDTSAEEDEAVGIYGEEYGSYETTVPYELTQYDNVVFFEIPIDSLTFPRKGHRRFKFSFGFIDKHDEDISYFESEKELFYTVEEDGYLDILDKRPRIEELAINMAFIMSSIDGNIDTIEGKEVSSIGKEILEDYPDDEKNEAKERINGYIKVSYSQVQKGNLHIDDTINEINSLCDIKTKHEIFEFCLKVAAADGIADKHEVDLAYYMADKFNLDKEEYKKQLEKVLPITMQDNDLMKNTFEKTLGIEEGMSKTEINDILKKEFKKWNQRVAHSDPSKERTSRINVN